jgi:LacI family gluconate utilization system Gnt-I transcriptional repressor
MAELERASGKVLMSDVAERAGVSQSTVSRVVNGQAGVSPEVVAQVMAAVKSLGYEPPVRRRPERVLGATLALLVLDDHYLRHVDVFNAILSGVHLAANRSAASLVFVQSSDPELIAAKLAQHEVSGLLLAGTALSPEVAAVIAGLPAVWLSSYHDQAGDHVLAGNEAIGKLAGAYLVEQRGHRDLAYLVTGTGYPAFQIRRQAFEFYAFAQRVPVQVIEGEPGFRQRDPTHYLGELEAHAERLVEALLELDPLPTGIFIPYDLLTALVYRHLLKRNVRIGQQLEIISCNNQPTCLAGLAPRPATIDIGAAAIGTHAVEQLLWRMKYPEVRQHLQLLVEPALVPGELLRQRWS